MQKQKSKQETLLHSTFKCSTFLNSKISSAPQRLRGEKILTVGLLSPAQKKAPVTKGLVIEREDKVWRAF